MAVTDEKDGALATAAVAAAAGIAAYGLRKALSSGGSSSGGSSQRSARNRDEDEDYEDDENEDENDGGSSRAGALLGKVRRSDSDSGGSGSLLQTVWDSAAGSIMPLAEEAADAAGKWTAKNAPDVVRDELVPRFIEAFNDAA
jgi:hypothetical protein